MMPTLAVGGAATERGGTPTTTHPPGAGTLATRATDAVDIIGYRYDLMNGTEVPIHGTVGMVPARARTKQTARAYAGGKAPRSHVVAQQTDDAEEKQAGFMDRSADRYDKAVTAVTKNDYHGKVEAERNLFRSVDAAKPFGDEVTEHARLQLGRHLCHIRKISVLGVEAKKMRVDTLFKLYDHAAAQAWEAVEAALLAAIESRLDEATPHQQAMYQFCAGNTDVALGLFLECAKAGDRGAARQLGTILNTRNESCGSEWTETAAILDDDVFSGAISPLIPEVLAWIKVWLKSDPDDDLDPASTAVSPEVPAANDRGLAEAKAPTAAAGPATTAPPAKPTHDPVSNPHGLTASGCPEADGEGDIGGSDAALVDVHADAGYDNGMSSEGSSDEGRAAADAEHEAPADPVVDAAAATAADAKEATATANAAAAAATTAAAAKRTARAAPIKSTANAKDQHRQHRHKSNSGMIRIRRAPRSGAAAQKKQQEKPQTKLKAEKPTTEAVSPAATAKATDPTSINSAGEPDDDPQTNNDDDNGYSMASKDTIDAELGGEGEPARDPVATYLAQLGLGGNGYEAVCATEGIDALVFFRQYSEEELAALGFKNAHAKRVIADLPATPKAEPAAPVTPRQAKRSPSDEVVATPAKKLKVFPCRYDGCGKMFARPDTAQIHADSSCGFNSNPKTFPCDVCNITLKESGSLLKHKRTQRHIARAAAAAEQPL